MRVDLVQMAVEPSCQEVVEIAPVEHGFLVFGDEDGSAAWRTSSTTTP